MSDRSGSGCVNPLFKFIAGKTATGIPRPGSGQSPVRTSDRGRVKTQDKCDIRERRPFRSSRMGLAVCWEATPENRVVLRFHTPSTQRSHPAFRKAALQRPGSATVRSAVRCMRLLGIRTPCAYMRAASNHLQAFPGGGCKRLRTFPPLLGPGPRGDASSSTRQLLADRCSSRESGRRPSVPPA